MKLEFEGQNITCEDDLRRLAERINCDAKFANRIEKYGIKGEHIDVEVLIRGYREEVRKCDRKQFRKEHECTDCADDYVKSCIGIPPCKYEEDFQREKKVKYEKAICPMDKKGDCPYGRPEGMCIGMPGCYRELIEGFRGGNGRNEKSKKEAHNGKR